MFRMNGMKNLTILALTAIVLSASGALAANDDSYIQLTRISLIDGNVGYQRIPDEEWSAVSVNMPLEPGDRIYTGRNGRVEIEFEEGSVLRLAENTDIEVLTLDEDYVQIRMLLGIASITVEKNVVFEFATPAAAFIAERSGIYRFEIAENGRSDAIVRKGQLEAVNNNLTRDIRNGEIISLFPDDTRTAVTAYNRRDAWDEWTDRRDADRLPTSNARRYIPDNISIGVVELDRNGRWVYVTNYGWGWVPNSVATGWSPYSIGRWVYRPRYGWTWVSYETWGWLPYHYGRWYRDTRVGWVWIPGESVTFRFWSPGLVVFYRGAGWVSWGPLGPGDYYDVSYYHYRRAYVGDLVRVRLLITRQPGNYINRNARGAFITVNIDGFRGSHTSGQNTNTRRNDINEPWRQGNLIRGGLDISPTRESYRPAPERQAERPRAETNRPVVVRRPPPQQAGGGNNDRFTQINNPRGYSKPERPNVERPTAERPTAERPTAERPNADRGNNNSKPAPSQENRQPERPNTSGAGAGRPNNTDSPSRAPANENRDRPVAAKPAPSTDSPSRAPANENRDRPAAAKPAPSTDSPSRVPANENRDRPAAAKPAPSQESRQPERPNTGNSSSSSARPTRESGAAATGSSSGSGNQQSAPAQGSKPTTAASSAPAQGSKPTTAAPSAPAQRSKPTTAAPSAPAQRSQSTTASPSAPRSNPAPSSRDNLNSRGTTNSDRQNQSGRR